MRGAWTRVLILVISAFCLQAQEGNPGADVWVSADTYPFVIDGCLPALVMGSKRGWTGKPRLPQRPWCSDLTGDHLEW